MDYDLMRAVEQAWARVEPILQRDPAELQRRLARRNLGLLTRRWPRAWCVAVRACDTRITGMHFVLTPSRPQWWDERHHAWRYVEHEVILEAPALRWLCRPVTIPAPGVEWTELAEMLGVNKTAVGKAIKRGELSVRYIKGLGGKHGKPIPVVYTRRELDPAGIPLGRICDPAWGTNWRYVSDHVPEGFSQPLIRRPVHRPRRRNLEFRGWLWVCPRCAAEVTRLYLPIKGLVLAPFVDESLVRGSSFQGSEAEAEGTQGDGHALPRGMGAPPMRSSPSPGTPGEGRGEGPSSSLNPEPRTLNPDVGTPGEASGSSGCPRAGRGEGAFLPLPLGEGWGEGHSAIRDSTELVEVNPRSAMDPIQNHKSKIQNAPAFACGKCHGVHDYGRLGAGGWDDLIAHLTAGLLYGHEVTPPSWWTPQRKRAYKPHPRYPKSKRRPQITALLATTTLTRLQIAKRLGLTKGTIDRWAGKIYRERNVHSREELKRVGGQTKEQTLAAAG